MIDSSFEDMPYYREEFANSIEPSSDATFSNIQAAMKSIQEYQVEEQKKDKKKVTIMSVQEEEALEK